MKKHFLIITFLIFLCGCNNVSILPEIMQPTPTHTTTPANEIDETFTDTSNPANIEKKKYVGNSNSNLYMGGAFAEDDNWIYFSPNQIYYDYCSNSFYRISHDHSEISLIVNENAFYINLSDDWIFYLAKENVIDDDVRLIGWGSFVTDGIYKVKKDGSNKELLLKSDTISSMILIDDYIYFSSELGIITKMSLDGEILGSLNLDVLDSTRHTLQFDNGNLYFSSLIDENTLNAKYVLYKLDFDLNDIEVYKFASPCEVGRYNNCCIVEDNLVYFDSELGVTQSSFDGKRKEIISEDVNTFIVANNNLFTCLTENIFLGKNEIIKANLSDNSTVVILELPEMDGMTTINLIAFGRENLYFSHNYGGSDTFDIFSVSFSGDKLKNLSILTEENLRGA